MYCCQRAAADWITIMILLQRKNCSKYILGLWRRERDGVADPNGRLDRAAMTIWPFLNWFPLFPLQKYLTRKKQMQSKPPSFLWYLSALGIWVHDQMLLVHIKTTWRPWNKWPLTFSAVREITRDLYQDSHTRESPPCKCSCTSKIVLLLVMFIYQQNLSGGRIGYVDKSTALLLSCLPQQEYFVTFSSFSGKDLWWKLWSQIKVHALYSWEAAVLLCVQWQQTSAYLTPYKVVVKKENGEKHFTINLD